MSLEGASRDMIRLGGRPVDPSNLKDAMMRAVLDGPAGTRSASLSGRSI